MDQWNDGAMAGDWLKWVKGLERKREVLMIACALTLTPEEVAGRLMRLWDWCDDNITDDQVDENGNAVVTLGAQQIALIDALTGAKGFADAMITTGWLVNKSGSLTFPNYARHNGKTAKTRALSGNRMKRKRYAAVTLKALPEKRREELKETKAKKAFRKPTIEQVAAYCAERGNDIDPKEFIASNDQKGWVVGKNQSPMRDWKAAILVWESNRKKSATPQPIRAKLLTPEREKLITAETFVTGLLADGTSIL